MPPTTQPTDLQKRILCRMKNSFLTSDIRKGDRNVVQSSFRVRGWITSEYDIGDASLKRQPLLFKLTKLGKQKRKEYTKQFKEEG